MNSIEFSKKCRPYNLQYREIFGYVPCKGQYRCSQEKYLDALIKSVETKRELASYIPRRNIVYLDSKPIFVEFILSDNDDYVTRINNINIKIKKEKYNDENVAYIYKMANLYKLKKEEILNVVLKKLGRFYGSRYTTEEIVEKLGEPYIEIIDKNYGTIVWLEHTLDEHIIECEFGDDMKLYSVIVDG